jgi:hypothetical protein
MGLETAIAMGVGIPAMAGAFGSGKGDMPDMGSYETPSPPNYYQMARQLMKAQKDFTPDVYNMEAQWGPKFNQLDFENLQKMSPQYQDLIMGLQKKFQPQGMEWQAELQKRFAPMMEGLSEQANNRQRERDLAAIKEYAPRYKEAMEAINPQETAMRKLLGEQIQGQLNNGTQLDPSLAREMQQGIRAAQGARGMMHGNAPVSAEALMTGQAAENLRSSRESKAFGYLGLPTFNASAALSGQAPAQGQAQSLMAAAPIGTEGMGMVKNRGAGMFGFKDEAMPLLNNATQQWQSQNQVGLANLAQSQNQANLNWQNKPSWLNALPMMGMAAGGLGAGLFGSGGMFGGGGGGATMPATGGTQLGWSGF